MILAPIHVTGFFFPVIKKEVYRTGSLGAGFSLAEYVGTKVRPRNDSMIKVYFNGEDVTSEACTSKQAAKEFFKCSKTRKGVDIVHKFTVPVSCGLATSGAGALGVVYALNETFDTSFSPIKLATLAHLAEVKQKTGLGSVIAQYKGKFEVRVKAGSPKIGKVQRFHSKAKCAIIIYDQIETKEILGSKQRLREIRQGFGEKHTSLMEHFSIEHFINLSYQFATETRLLTPFLQKVLKNAREVGLKGSMLMLGNGVFLFGKHLEEKLPSLMQKLSKKPRHSFVTKIDNKGVVKTHSS